MESSVEVGSYKGGADHDQSYLFSFVYLQRKCILPEKVSGGLNSWHEQYFGDMAKEMCTELGGTITDLARYGQLLRCWENAEFSLLSAFMMESIVIC
ncbi:hypothetical protein BSKO_08054 [Bryopsis sp. KO-2023]|nr:hypothetical protein BSKO_08054 [Bryopsis sp. KO-2023]